MSHFRETHSIDFILPIKERVRPILEGLMYMEDILYRRLVMQLIFDLILNDQIRIAASGDPIWFIEREIRNFVRIRGNAKIGSHTVDELIEDAEDLYRVFYRYYRDHLRYSFKITPRIDFYEIRPYGIFFKVTVFSD